MNEKARKYIAKILEQKSFAAIAQDVSNAFRKGFLSNIRAGYYDNYAINLPLQQFIREYELTWKTHDEFSLKLIELVPQLSEESLTKLCNDTLPLLEQALENDAKVTGFTMALSEDRPDNKFREAKNSIEKLLRESDIPQNIAESFFVPATFFSFEAELYFEVSAFLSGLTSEFFSELSKPESAVDDLKKSQDFLRIQKAADDWSYGNVEQLVLWLRPYTRVALSLGESAREQKRKMKESFEEKKSFVMAQLTDNSKIQEFLSLVEIAQTLLRMEQYTEPKSRFNMRGGFGDYLLRELIARTLYSYGYAESPNPMDMKQDKLLESLQGCIETINS